MGTLKTIDLFSGVGGITLALSGFATPVMYCDVDPIARTSLQYSIKNKRLPKAPIEEDVKCIKIVPKVDMVVGGFPCVGLSARGKLEGFEHEGSGLFYNIMDIVDRSGAKAVFLENVPGVKFELAKVIKELSIKRGFQLRWEHVSARDVGAPHERKRWFCLGIKLGSKLPNMNLSLLGKHYKAYDWSGDGPARTCPKSHTPEARLRSMARWGLMGNSVVPDAVRLAFCRLYSGGQCQHLDKDMVLEFCEMTSVDKMKSGGIRVVQPGKAKDYYYEPQYPIIVKGGDKKLVFDPKLRKQPLKKPPTQTTPNIVVPVKSKQWATPAHSQVYSQRILSERSIHVLPTQVRYERKTKGRENTLAGNFVEWMMGYPLGYTDFGNDEC